MNLPLVVVDTNVLISGLITHQPQSPTCLILDWMLEGRLRFVLSIELLSEYRRVLLRPGIRKFHKLRETEVDIILNDIAFHGILREAPLPVEHAPDRGDDHLWALMAAQAGTVLITGDKALLKNPPDFAGVISPLVFVRMVEDMKAM
ncbi:MAG: putative toxin-antitoxin system toxin component, PIN family [Deltaproteobacteria bacterium]|nr:putative toxin-antitoxin system toxin component, PIN family [Deltaproteobacteria bacterium]MBW1738731.1 putative toxin-antitoxin system toxin component, PIN family [Deltaproteobacteria bacterium]MBW1908430.1 putative toxin-antitoxin system toxin component, PIN family [Deltaproteobacteria bacterium]MBW2035406.1 putative toxin-antitoxin system toxin component, PIN family [Deltaproteobacteria bacterium]MBW2115953.1 putative toxin-antitoxin system toxin component, PIN family [Deltaproteobacteria